MSGAQRNIIGHAAANPTKAFFVRMLTRDISLDDCILDLIDNSIDGAWKSSGKIPTSFVRNKDLSDFSIDVEFSDEVFRITDNCGGITFDDAVNYAFTFGASEQHRAPNYSVGVYGIGMKRAVFKIGNEIAIDSTFRGPKKLEAFRVPINVDKWLSSTQPSWDFDIDELEPRKVPGVDIEIRSIRDEVRMTLADPEYAANLRRVLARDYMVSLMRGLNIKVCGKKVEAPDFEILSGVDYAPMRITKHEKDVKIEIVAGMWSSPPDDNEPEESGRQPDVQSGWYVICNGRVVLDADRTSVTGWGRDGDLPQWHTQYKGFVGVVFFSSKRPELLPMTTTKRNIDVSSALYLRTLPLMREPTRAWINYTNGRKNNPSAREKEAKLKAVDITAVRNSAVVKLPSFKMRAKDKVANVNYTVPVQRMRNLARALGNPLMNYKEVGQKSFDIVYDEYMAEDQDS